MEIVIALCWVVVGFVFAGAIWLYVDKQYAARLTAAIERERALQSTLELERIARAEETTGYAERLAASIEREKALAERIEEQDAPMALAGIAERAATLILKELPIDARERERMAACAALGGLMTAHHFIGAALNVMLQKVDLSGDIFHLQYDDSANDEIVDDEDQRDSDPSNVQ